MKFFVKAYNYRPRFLVVVENKDRSLHDFETCMFNEPFLNLKYNKKFIDKSQICRMTEGSGARDDNRRDENTLLLNVTNSEYVYFSGYEIMKFNTEDRNNDFLSVIGNNMLPYAIAAEGKYTFFISHFQKVILKKN